MLKKLLSMFAERLLSYSRKEYCLLVVSVLFGVSLSWADLNSVELHARWTPDLTTNTQPVCVKDGTVGGGVEFHLVAYYSPPVRDFVCDSMVIEEQTPYHPPQTMTITSFNSSSSLGCCSSPPPPGQSRALFCTLPTLTYSFHNTAYKVTANYHYMIMQGLNQPPTRVDGSISITVNFQNLVVEAQPKILKWDPNVPENCDTTFSYTLSSAQKKNCQVQILIYDMEGNVVYQTNLTQLCPGTYTFTWDGTTSSGSIAPTGLYTFDIIANGKTPDGQIINEDKDEMRSSLLKIQQTYMDIDPDNPGKFKFGYVLESVDGKLPSELEVKVYGSALENFVEKTTLQGGKKVIPPGTTPTEEDWNFVSFSQDLFQVGGALEVPRADRLYAVVVGKDDDVNNKAHNRKPILERNQEARTPTAALFSREPQGENNQAYKAMVEAKNQLCSGVFKKIMNDIVVKNAFKFDEKWKYPSQNGYEEVPMVVAGGDENYSMDKLIKALKNVDVFAYFGPGDGNAILLGDTTGTLAVEENFPPSRSTNYPNLSLIDDVIGDGKLSNLHLVVIITCKWGGYNGSPIVQKLVAKGAKFGIHLTGHKPAQNPQNKMWYIYPPAVSRWSSLFWKAVTKGYTEEETGKIVYPTMGEAAKWACDKEYKERERGITKDPLIGTSRLEVFTYGNEKLYLGDISLK